MENQQKASRQELTEEVLRAIAQWTLDVMRQGDRANEQTLAILPEMIRLFLGRPE